MDLWAVYEERLLREGSSDSTEPYPPAAQEGAAGRPKEAGQRL